MSHLLIVATVLLSPLSVSGHSNIVWPNTWFDKGGVLGMTPGAQCAGGGDTGIGPCMWFSNYTFISGEPTLPDYMRTFQDLDIGGYPYDYTKVSWADRERGAEC